MTPPVKRPYTLGATQKLENSQERQERTMLEREPEICMLHREFEVQLFFDAYDTRKAQRISYIYSVVTPTGVIFEGTQYRPSPFERDDIAIVDGLLFWICLRPGDTDQEHFKDYTPEQLAWAQSFECEIASAELSEVTA